MDTAARVAAFRRLHESACFVIPNPWDAGSARLLEGLGFPALATTSSGLAWSLGRPDHGVSLAEALAHFRAVSAAVGVPVSADFEGGLAREPEDVADHVARAATTGIAGLSIEDSSGDDAEPLFEFSLALQRVRAARGAIDASGAGLVLTARSEGFLVGRGDLPETIRRLSAYAEAGADCLYAPGLPGLPEVREIVQAVAPKAVNVLATASLGGVDDLARAGVRRISLGGALARTAWTGFLAAAREIAERGTFGALAGIVTTGAINASFAKTPGSKP
ncbi:MAG: isocitrate lyase/PEP mutase family protein [Syntrophomonadaceae bacterium]